MPKKGKLHIDHKELPGWFAVTGFNLPRTEGELARFEKLHQDFEHQLTGEELDPSEIWNMDQPNEVKVLKPPIDEEIGVSWRMAARNLGSMSDQVRAKMNLNQENLRRDVDS